MRFEHHTREVFSTEFSHDVRDLECAVEAAQNSATRDLYHAVLDEEEAERARDRGEHANARKLMRRAGALRRSARAYDKKAKVCREKLIQTRVRQKE